MSRLKKRYQEEIKGELQKKFTYSNPMKIPALKKVVISMGVAEAIKDKNVMQDCAQQLALISGQKPLITRAKKSIANFKLREGQAIGLKVTLRGKRMYDFFDRFCNIVCPRIRDFRGFNKNGDKRGSYSLGLAEQQAFPELNLDTVKKEQGMNVTFVTSAENDEESLELLTQLGLPFKH
ncbi:MAG: 50S ribosomal protein L5 [Simkaniaceae bacterium]|nr:50S ribosomal protein L5 [Simkaniaceae bacterium]